MTTNPITGDALRTRPSSDKYRENWDAIFKKEPGDTGSSLLEDRKDEEKQEHDSTR